MRRIHVDTRVNFPIHVETIETGEVKRFDNVEQLSWLEDIDVEAREYHASDAKGNALKLSVSQGSILRPDGIHIELGRAEG